MDKTRIYISGKITGLEYEQAAKKFNDAEVLLKKIGLIPVNPLKNGLTTNHTWKQHMVRDIELLFDCGGILMLDNWRDSKGAAIEYEIARKMQMDIWHESAISRTHIVISAIKKAIYEVMGLKYSDYTSKSRKQNYFFARMIMAHHCTRFGIDVKRYIVRDRVTYFHYRKKYKDECRFNPAFNKIATEINLKIDEYIKNAEK